MKLRTVLLIGCCLLLAGCMQVPSNLAAKKNEKTVITVLYGQSTTDPGTEDIFIKKITEEFDVELEWESVDWGEYFFSEMQAKIAAGEVPDLIIGKAQDVAGYYSSGFLGKFDSNFNKYINEEALDSVTINGELYGIPYNALYQGVIYNKNILFRYNIDVPTTIESLHEAVERLRQVGVTPFASHFKENWYSGNVLMQVAVNEVFSATPDWGDKFRSNEVSFSDSIEYRYCFDQVKYILENSWEDALSTLQDGCDKRFATEEAAMYVSGTWSVQTISYISPKIDIGIFPYPNSTGDADLLFEPNVTFMKNSNSENNALVDDIIMALLKDPDLIESVALFTQTEPLIKGMTTNSLFMIKDDIDQYNQRGKVKDVSIGNSQIVWRYQEEIADRMFNWFDGSETLEDILDFADKRRADSGGYIG